MSECIIEYLVRAKNNGVGESKSEHDQQESLGVDYCTGVSDWFGNHKSAHTSCDDEEALVDSKVQVGANGVTSNVQDRHGGVDWKVVHHFFGRRTCSVSHLTPNAT